MCGSGDPHYSRTGVRRYGAIDKARGRCIRLIRLKSFQWGKRHPRGMGRETRIPAFLLWNRDRICVVNGCTHGRGHWF
jgi:hypothetical protein